jgi:hypothetical protein
VEDEKVYTEVVCVSSVLTVALLWLGCPVGRLLFLGLSETFDAFSLPLARPRLELGGWFHIEPIAAPSSFSTAGVTEGGGGKSSNLEKESIETFETEWVWEPPLLLSPPLGDLGRRSV